MSATSFGPTRAERIAAIWKPSLIEAKFLMALTGAGLLLFVVAHMLGNLQIFLGQDAINGYAKKLKGMPAVLWFARFGLLAMFSGHLATAAYIRRWNRIARPSGYVVADPMETTLASRTMLSSGLAIFGFLIYHLLHFTLGVTSPAAAHLVDGQGRHDVYSMVVLSFQNIYVALIYIVAMFFLSLHLSHAASSIFQTLGLVSGRYRLWAQRAGLGIAAVILVGNISIPLFVFCGVLQLPTEGVTP